MGLAAAIATPEGLSWQAGLGAAELGSTRPFRSDASVINVASVSKTVTAATIALLVEQQRLGLDDPIAGHLGFRLGPPGNPRRLTVRHLLTHTAAVADGPAYEASYALGDPAETLGAWLERYFDPSGDLHDPRESWHPWEPGTRWSYSNVGYGLLGHIAERAGGEDFRSLTRRLIFDPLEMRATGWFLADVEREALATPHAATPVDPGSSAAGLAAAPPGTRWQPLEHYGFPTYPDGLLRTTAADLARFLSAMLVPADRGGLLGATWPQVFDPDPVVAGAPDPRLQGLAWRAHTSPSGRRVWSHGGADPGVASLAVVDLTSGIGVALVANCEAQWPRSASELVDSALATAR